MAENKQAALNGAYYGPSIPPSEPTRRSGRGCAGRCCCCFLSLLWKIVLGIVILIGVALLILYLIYQPQGYKVHVTDAGLTEFNLDNTTSNLHYNLALDMAVRNPNKKYSFHFEKMEARVYYEDQRLAAKNYTNFMLKKKTGTNLKFNMKGQSLLLLSASGLKEFNEDKAAGVYRIDLKFRPRNFFRLGDFTFSYMYPKVNCRLKVPLKGSNATFKTTKCSVKFKVLKPF